MGQEQTEKLVKRQTALSKPVAVALAKLSRGKRVQSAIDFYAEGISAKEFVGWFEEQSRLNNTAAMLQAHPEHYVIDNRPDSTQYVCETTGGSPMVSEFKICFGNTGAIAIPLREDCPYRIEGVSVQTSGLCIGGARHQFKDTPEGLHGFLSIDFPKITPRKMVDGHKWHLAIEFANWVEAAVSGKYDEVSK